MKKAKDKLLFEKCNICGMYFVGINMHKVSKHHIYKSKKKTALVKKAYKKVKKYVYKKEKPFEFNEEKLKEFVMATRSQGNI